MSNDSNGAEGNGRSSGAKGEGGENAPQVSVLAQFIKDLSFENPNAPGALKGAGGQANIEIAIQVRARQADEIAEDVFESEIDFKARASAGDTVLYNLEIVYAGAFRLTNVPEAMRTPVLHINCPALLYPFLRRLIAELTHEGGYPPLLLDPVDFAAVFARNMSQAAANDPGEAEGESHGDDGGNGGGEGGGRR